MFSFIKIGFIILGAIWIVEKFDIDVETHFDNLYSNLQENDYYEDERETIFEKINDFVDNLKSE